MADHLDAKTTGRAPLQARSRARVVRILEVAADLISRQGSEHLKMSEIASAAGISIGSLYQYFPDKAAVVRGLAQSAYDQTRRCVAEALVDVADRDGLARAWGDLVELYWSLYQAEPVLRDIFAGVQADRALAAMEIAESRACGAMLAEAVLSARPDADRDSVATTAFLIWQLGEATMRLAASVERAEADKLVAAYIRIGLEALLAA